jgi:acetyltransferase-like isoleucine patch superfamily enzyme
LRHCADDYLILLVYNGKKYCENKILMKKLLSIIVLLFPWALRRVLLIRFWKYDIHPNAKIGLSYIYPKHLKMSAGSRIDHFCIAIHLDSIILEEEVTIGRSNWITGFPSGTNSQHFIHQTGRRSILMIGKESAITKNHHIDCTSPITIGKFTTIAGYHSQLLTHSINLNDNRQDSNPINIGDYCFVGTNVVILGGASLPSYSVLGAKSMLNKAYIEEWKIYGGNPALPIKDISKQSRYFSRANGYVV